MDAGDHRKDIFLYQMIYVRKILKRSEDRRCDTHDVDPIRRNRIPDRTQLPEKSVNSDQSAQSDEELPCTRISQDRYQYHTRHDNI